MSWQLLRCALVLTAVLHHAQGYSSNSGFAEPDVSTTVPREHGSFLLEAFRAGAPRRSDPQWFSLGDPQLVPSRDPQDPSQETIFDLQPNRVGVRINTLTASHRQQLAAAARDKYQMPVGEQQFLPLPFSDVQCRIVIANDHGQQFLLTGGAADLTTFPFRVDFKAPKNTPARLLLEELMKSEIDRVNMNCTFAAKVRDALTVSAERLDELRVVERLFGASDMVYLTRGQLGALSSELYRALSIPRLYGLTKEQFSPTFVRELLMQTATSMLGDVDVDDALAALSSFALAAGDAPTSADLKAALASLFSVRRIHDRDQIVLNHHALPHLQQRQSCSGLPVSALFGIVIGPSSQLNPAGLSLHANALDRQLAELNSFPDSDVHWAIDGDHLVPQSIRAIMVSRRNFQSPLHFSSISREVPGAPFVREIHMQIVDPLRKDQPTPRVPLDQQQPDSNLEAEIERLTAELQEQQQLNAKLQSQNDVLVPRVAELTALLNATEEAPQPTAAEELCTTEVCVESVASVLQNMDRKADPCKDFYQYSCGGFIENEEIPDDESMIGYFVKIQRDLDAKLRGLLERPVVETEPMAVKNAKNLYQSCMNEDLIDKVSLPAFHRLCEAAGGWPLMTDNYTRDWVQVVHNLRQQDFNMLIDFAVTVDSHNSSLYILRFDEASLGLPSKNYFEHGFDSPYVKSYYDYAVSAVAGLSSKSRDAVRKAMKDVVEFEMKLAELTMDKAQRENSTARYNKMTLEEMNDRFPGVDWVWYAQSLVGDRVINASEPVLIFALDYYRGLMDLVKETEPETILNYVFWRVFKNQMDNLPKWIRVFQARFQKTVFGIGNVEARWRTCTSMVQSKLSFVLGRMYIENYFDSKSIPDLSNMVGNLKKAFEELIQDNKWMDADTKKVAVDKVRSIGQAIGYPEWILEDRMLDSVYEDYHFDPEAYFDNIMQLKEVSAHDTFRALRARTSKGAWSSSPSEINAYYSASKNRITFPAAILHPPFYHVNHSRSLNFGGIGSIMGHEITHGFDSDGRRYDKDGNLRQWWSKESTSLFKNRATCVANQYSRFHVPSTNLSIDGLQTLGENIADNGGIKASYHAYLEWINKNGEEKNLPAINLNHRQLFFVSFAQIWCSKSTPEATVQRVLSAVHSPHRFRVLGTLMNFNEFADAFNCPLSSPMNPVDKCSIW